MADIWKTWGVSVIGSGHKKNKLPNQDAWISQVYKDGAVLAVSDGLGSKPLSDKGSKAACAAVVRAAGIIRRHPRAGLKNIPALIHSLWLMKTEPLLPVDCGATCLFAFTRGEKIILGRLGDGMIIAVGEEAPVLLEDEKEFANLTYCLDDALRINKWEIKEINARDYNAVIMCTDGIADDIDPEKKADFARELFMGYKSTERIKRHKEISKWLREWDVPGNLDDKTLACLYREDL